MSKLKQKTINGLIWSAVDSFSGQGILFLVGIVLARILSPREFGLIGMVTIFIAISESFINSGFSNALIRKNNCTQSDLSTVFYFNLTFGIIFFLLLFSLANSISIFFNEPELKQIIRVLSTVLIIDSVTIIQKTILIKLINFKLQAKISVIAAFCGGIISIIMAYSGFGVWALVTLQLSKQLITSLLLWLWNNWKPTAVFSINSFKELFGFGSKLLVSGLIDTLYNNIYYFIIGKHFSAQDLGFYSRADNFKNLPSQHLNGIISKVSYPVLASIQDNIPQLKTKYKILIRSTMFITFTLMMGMSAVAEPMIITLIGEKWRSSILYLQMLCFVGMMYPLHSLNLNMLKVQGRSDLFLKLEIIKKALAVPIIIMGIIWGIRIMIVGMIVNTLIAYYLNSYWSGSKIGYPLKEQLRDILPSFGLAIFMGVCMYFLGRILPFNYLWVLLSQITAGATFIFLFCEITRFRDYIYLKSLIIEKVKDIKKNRRIL